MTDKIEKTIYISESKDREGSIFFDATLDGEPIDYAYNLEHLIRELTRNYPDCTIERI
jgi:hypothetical protein